MKKIILGKNRYEKNRVVARVLLLGVVALFAALAAVVFIGAPGHVLAVAGILGGAKVLGGSKFLGAVIAPFKFIEPVTKVSNNVGNGNLAVFEFPKKKRINNPMLVATVTKAAAGAGITSIPAISDILGLCQFKIDGNPNRSRLASELWGKTGLNALMSRKCGGMVVYSQVGNANLKTVPVLMGSVADAGAGYQGSLTANLATTCTFYLPLVFSESFRKEYDKTEALALATGFDNGDDIGPVTLECQIPDTSGAAVAISGQKVTISLEYDELVAKANSAVSLVKEYRHGVPYSQSGDIECALNLADKKGDLMRISLLTATDKITKVVVKQGARIIRNVTFGENAAHLVNREYNEDALISNRFDIELDLNDDPQSSLTMEKDKALSIVASLATANDAAGITVLSSFFGEKE